MGIIILLLSLACMGSASVLRGPDDSGNFELVILHNNDMHARFEQTSQLSGTCSTADRDAGKCYGGFARVAHVVKEARAAANRGEAPPVLYLNAGDTYTGTAWFTIYKWRIAAELLNALNPDAVSLGNNELKNGGYQLPPYLETLNTAVLSSNVILHADKNNKIHKSKTFDIRGTKVGVVGFLTPDNPFIDEAGNIEYIDELIAIKREVKALKSDNVNIIIALGHSSFDKSLEIAHEVDGIDVVITGHKNVFYWNGTSADKYNEEPSIVTQKSGRQIPVFQSYAYNNFLGKIIILFDDKGEIKFYSNDPILLDYSISEDPKSLIVVKNVAAEVRNEEIGVTAVVLDGNSCKGGECNLGNLITDAMMYIYAVNYEGERWTDAPIAIIHSGAISGSISHASRPATITTADLMSVLPSESTIVAVTMSGTVLNQVLEHSVSNLNANNPSEQFLQFSGIRVVYDLSLEPGSRVVSALVRCWACFVPEYFTIDTWRDYKILMPASLADGQYGYDMLVGLPREETNRDEISVTAEYIGLRSPVYPDVAGRIEFHTVDSEEPATTTSVAPPATTVIGETAVVLDGSSCKEGECNLGNLITDAMMYIYAVNYQGERWTDAPIAIIHSGAIEGSISPENRPASITTADLMSVLPSESTIVAVTMSGTVLNQVLEHSVSNLNANNPSEQFLQFSGIRVVYDLSLEPGSRVVSALVRCWACFVPEYFTIDTWRDYKILMPASLADGQYGYDMLVGLPREETNRDEISVTAEYIGLRSPVYPDVAGRIEFHTADSEEPATTTSVAPPATTVIGETAVVLDGSSCKEGECNLGNLITDAMMYIYAVNYQGERWTDAPIAIIHSGAIEGSISPENRPASITTADLMSVLPSESTIVAVTMSGTVLNQVLEHSVSNLNANNPSEQFLQFSGIRVVYDLSLEPGSRVVSALVRCWACFVPEYFTIDTWRDYKILMPASLADGQYGYDMLVGLPIEETNRDEISVTAEYIGLRSPVYPDVAGRIEFHTADSEEPATTTSVAPPATTVIGETAVVLDGSSCKEGECNLGNLITDAMMYIYAVNYQGERWTDAPIAIIHSGAIEGSISPENRPASITTADLMSILPSESTIVAVTMSGTVLNQLLEHSVSNLNANNPSEQFLQFSGIRVVYDLSLEPGSRVVNALVRCWACFVPEYFTIDTWRDYKILMPASLADGQYGYDMLVGLPREETNRDEISVTAEYIGLRSPVYPDVAGRITFYTADSEDSTETPPATNLPDSGTTNEPALGTTTAVPDSSTAVSSTFKIIFVVTIINYIMSY